MFAFGWNRVRSQVSCIGCDRFVCYHAECDFFVLIFTIFYQFKLLHVPPLQTDFQVEVAAYESYLIYNVWPQSVA